jgi:carbon storage regulator
VLVVTRRRNEAIIIGDGIEVRVLRTGRDGVRLGISAPPHVAVHRQEVYDLIRAVNATAADGPAEIGGLVKRLRSRASEPDERKVDAASLV